MPTKSPKVLVLDVETSPIVAYVWSRKNINVALNQIKDDWAVIAWAAKWLDDSPSEVMYKDQRNAKNVKADKKLLQPLWKLLNQADIVLTQNGTSFDGPRLNARFILHGMKPPSPYRHLDTYRIARRVAQFTSNRLEYLTTHLCKKYKKLTHAKFPGMQLWKECLAGNKKAWDEMKTYNIHDVLATEELYHILKAWAPESMPKPYLIAESTQQCGVCGSANMVSNGLRSTNKKTYRRLNCLSCGAWSKGEVVK